MVEEIIVDFILDSTVAEDSPRLRFSNIFIDSTFETSMSFICLVIMKQINKIKNISVHNYL